MMSYSTNSDIVNSYSQNPVNNFIMKDGDISYHVGNELCGDNITVYLKIDKKSITNYSYSGECSTITSAAASFLTDLIIGQSFDTILTRDYTTMKNNGFVVSPRRKRAAVIAILATRNAIHTYQKDNKNDTFDDLLYND